MKRTLLVLTLVALTLFAWGNKYFLFHAYYELRHRAPKVIFSEYPAKKNVRIFYVKSPYLAAHIDSLADRLASNLENAEKLTGASLSAFTVYLYNNFEEKGNDIKDVSVSTANIETNAVHCIVNDKIDGTRERLEFYLLLHQKFGEAPAPDRLRIFTAALGNTWDQKTLEEWASFLLQRGIEPVLNEDRSISDFVRIPWCALFAKFVLENYGWKTLSQMYRDGSPPQGYQKKWDALVASLRPEGTIKSKEFHFEFQRGVSYAYANGYDTGYATVKSAQSLDQLKSMGVQWVAAIPYGFMRASDSTEIGRPGSHVFGENDESLFALSWDAKARGMKVMLKPQIWMHGGWTGDVEFPDQAAWNRWFSSYEQWILHYAIIAELTQTELLCIGTELSKTTLKQPDSWRRLIARVRQVYHGSIVYAANYGDEFEHIPFWDNLDYIGLDNYYPIRQSMESGMPEMKICLAQQKDKIRAVSERFHKPVLFTEIGYMAAREAGMSTKEDDVSGYDEQMQAQCYRLALETYWKEPWFAGMYWWKWFSDPGDRGQEADRFSPHGRPAEKIISEWYSKPH